MEEATCENGVCRIKHEFVLQEHNRRASVTADGLPGEGNVSRQHGADAETGETDVAPSKKRRLSKQEKKKQRGQNRSRPTYKCDRKRELCYSIITSSQSSCSRNDCSFLHDVEEYLKIKPPDIGEICYNFETSGRCNRGVSCRFARQHTDLDGTNIIDEQKLKAWEGKEPHTVNHLSQDLQQNLRKKHYDFKLSEALIKYNDRLNGKHDDVKGAVTDEDIIKLTSREKRLIDFKDKLSLSPLTTVGNLPFRRICKEFGADVTCGEMAMCSAVLQGAPQEWALVKRHHTEDVFGVQLCANNPHLLTKCGQLLQEEINIDFIDLNLGCPIELVYKEGAGCGLLRRTRVLESCIRNLSQMLRIPLTVKTRTGVYSNENIAHTLIPKFKDWGASLVTLHGRSREQRYTKLANWSYIEQCAQAASPMPLFGNGDILSYEDYRTARETCPSISGVVIGRGALIKPWIFTEIKERKLWDISSSERFDNLKKYVNYGLEHWGSDNKGVENTRRFLLEWLSFLYRYIPVGLLERPPQKINERPPYYRGRDDLETLMASPVASDWIKISEMFLGPVPESFQFLPKHKANAYK